jgi:anti-sigma regulatory factor (Ser/Thr protein kinase)
MSAAGAEAGELRLSVGNNADGYRHGFERVDERLTAWGVGGRARYVVELVFEEVMTNIMRHGLPAAEAHQIGIRMSSRGDKIVLAFDDAGVEFNPALRAPSSTDGSLETATIGGRGIAMIRKLAHSMRYERRDGRNHLEVVILHPGPPG